jgi:hypothetical protein
MIATPHVAPKALLHFYIIHTFLQIRS